MLNVDVSYVRVCEMVPLDAIKAKGNTIRIPAFGPIPNDAEDCERYAAQRQAHIDRYRESERCPMFIYLRVFERQEHGWLRTN